MNAESAEVLLPESDQEELTKLVNAIALSDGTLTGFAIAPDCGPEHPVVERLRVELRASDEYELELFYYSDNSLYNYLHGSEREAALADGRRRVIFAFGLETLNAARLAREMEQLNLGRESIFSRNIVLIFWLNQSSFLDEFRRRSPDFWDWRGKVVTFEMRPLLNPLLYPYLEWLITENSYLKMGGVMQVNRQVDIFLDQIYVALQAEWVEERSTASYGRREISQVRSSYKVDDRGEMEGMARESYFELEPEPELQERQRVTKMVDVASAVNKQSYGVILGEPGAGKTTLLRYLARHFAIAQRDRLPLVVGGKGEELGTTKLPILFRIADYTERMAQQPGLTLVEYLRQFYRQWEPYFAGGDGAKVAELLLEKMAVGNCLLLLDGLDEVFDQANRSEVVKQINQLVRDYSSNKFVVTSRISGYQEVSLGGHFREYTITRMGDEQIRQFLERWCLAVETAQRPELDEAVHLREAEREAAAIVEAITKKPGVKRFAENPLLLTILALIHRNGTSMPQRRVELYDLATKTLIEDWQLGRNIPYGARQAAPPLKEEVVMGLFAPLAFWMHEEKPSGLVTQAEVEKFLTLGMAKSEDVDEAVALEMVRQFLRQVREATGLFVERAPGVYGFMHLTFEEYFAARHIADNELDEILEMIGPYRNQARWNEPILLALGYLSATSAKRVNRLVEKLFPNLDDYLPSPMSAEIKLKTVETVPILVWSLPDDPEVKESAVWQDLLFVGQVLAEVKVSMKFCRKHVAKLVTTYLGLTLNYGDEHKQELLRLLRGIEAFHPDEVRNQLQQASEDGNRSKEQRNEATTALLYLTCSEVRQNFSEELKIIYGRFTPELFNDVRNLVEKFGIEMSPTIERSLMGDLDLESQQLLKLILGITYLRVDKYDDALNALESLSDETSDSLSCYRQWGISIAHQGKKNYDQAMHAYQDCAQQIRSFIPLKHLGICCRLHEKYQQSIISLEKALEIVREIKDSCSEANLLWEIGRTYGDWKKYQEAIIYYEQSRDIYQELGKEKDVAVLWDWISDAYRDWEKYPQALESRQQEMDLHEKMGDEIAIALSHCYFGRIYHAWKRYEKAIEYHEISRDLYEKLEKETNVANQWGWISNTYRDWEKYDQALESRQQELNLREKLDETVKIAASYFSFGRIYHAWKKYEKAIEYFEISRDRYQGLGKESDVARLWAWISVSYRDWENYDQALETSQEELNLREQLNEAIETATSYYSFGRIYHAWKKYGKAIEHFEVSRDRFQGLDKESEVATLSSWISNVYRDWEKYEQALESRQQELSLREKLDESVEIAASYFNFGRIYHVWKKYEKAIEYFEISRDRYQALNKESDAANILSWISNTYRDWEKYEQALESRQQELTIREKLDESVEVAASYFSFGRIYYAWKEYEKAVEYFEISRDRYQKLGKESDVANQLAWISDSYRDWEKYDQALETRQQELTLRETLDETDKIATSYFSFGRIYHVWKKYEKAIEYYEISRDRHQSLGKESDMANLLGWISSVYRDWEKCDQALESRQQELNLREKLDESVEIATSYFSFGRIYYVWKKYAKAIEYFEISRDRYQSLDKEADVARLWEWLSVSYRDWEKYDQALESLQQELNLREKLDESTEIATSYFSFGRIYHVWKKYEKAIEYFKVSRDRYQALGKETNVANQLGWISNTYRDWEKYDQALKIRQQELTLREKLDETAKVATSYFSLGRIYHEWQKYEKAIEYFEISRDRHQVSGKESSVADLLDWISDVYRDWEKYDQALEIRQQEFDLREKLDEPVKIAASYFSFGYIHHALGEHEKAIEYYEISRDRYQELGKESDVANLWGWLASSYRDWGKYEKALESQHYKFDLYQQIGMQSGIALICEQFGDIYLEWEKYEKAIEYYQQSHDRYQELDLQQNVAYQLRSLATCQQKLEKYDDALSYSRQSLEIHQSLDSSKSISRRLRQIANIYRLKAKTQSNLTAIGILGQANESLQKSIEIATTNEYIETLAYAYNILALITADRLRYLDADDRSIPELIEQVTIAHTTSIQHFTTLGQSQNQAEENLTIARAYLEIPHLQNLDHSETIGRRSLQIFQDFNSYKLQAAAQRLLGEIYLARAQKQEPNTLPTAHEFLTTSLTLYQTLDLTQKASEVQKLFQS